MSWYMVDSGTTSMANFEFGVNEGYAVGMMTSSNGNIICVTGHLRGEFTGPRSMDRGGRSWGYGWGRGEDLYLKRCSVVGGC